MLFFLIVMCVGLVGLGIMAVPGFFHHGLSGHAGGHAHGLHAPHHGHAVTPHSHGHAGPPSHGQVHAGPSHGQVHAAPSHGHGHAAHGTDTGRSLTQFIPEPRLIFSLLALYGAFGNVLAWLDLMPLWLSALVALLPALVVERLLLAPLWRLAFQFQGRPSSPFPALLLEEAQAVTPFRNGKGLVRVIRDGRSVQLSARLVEGQAMLPVRVGDRLRIEDVDPENERVTVSLL